MAEEARLVFVYNAESGLLNMLKDGLHKALSPKTYPCSLCALTYGAVSMKKEWARFIATIALPVEFRYRDTATMWLSEDAPLPTLLMVQGSEATPLMSAQDIDACSSLAELMDQVSARLTAAYPKS